ncbi:MAG: O-antigen polysaccharide polymerase Wzy [Meiothermus sp.]|uniref:O-antigen polysaccharide polymerase Wzy n=1 Tax=Meiothermus sp. TaxID=1955249 RepID=UPI0025F4CDC3|nr:O-antigen polysaccharide polymerase Wzy [Meiothermus sp.]MCS7068713.1 O-antigen polysaccharide polymerase Wzy [Meiothermus sp.]MDW8424901.1 O-antigen polysaccharide polymerase Wzy [Meiothermus sp.]
MFIEFFLIVVTLILLIVFTRYFGIFSTPALFMYSMLLFQIIPLLYGSLTNFYGYDLTRQNLLAILGMIAFAVGYVPLGLARNRALKAGRAAHLSLERSRAIFKVAIWGSLALFPLTAATALRFFLERRGGEYGLTEPISTMEQFLFYTALCFFALALSVNLKHIPLKWVWLLAAVVILPRLLVSLVYSRIFIFLAIIPLLYALFFSRLNFRLSRSKALLAFALLGLFVVVPALTRDTSVIASSQRFETLIMNGSSIPILEKYERYEINRDQSYVFASVVLKAIPFSVPLPDNYRIDVWGMEGAVATLDRVLSHHENQGRQDVFFGTGSNYLHELFIDFGWLGVGVGGILVGSVAAYIEYRGVTSILFRYIWLSILTSFLFLPRSNVGYFLEKLPLYLLFYLLIWLVMKIVLSATAASRKRAHARGQGVHNS